jgi:hypothetical protein
MISEKVIHIRIMVHKVFLTCILLASRIFSGRMGSSFCHTLLRSRGTVEEYLKIRYGRIPCILN